MAAASELIIFAIIAEVPIQFDRSCNLARRTNCRRRVSEFVYLWQTREIAPRGNETMRAEQRDSTIVVLLKETMSNERLRVAGRTIIP